MKFLRGLGVMAIVTGFAAPGLAQTTTAAAPAADVTGTWNVTFNTQQGAIPAQLILKKDGDKLVGTVSSQMGSSPVEAEVKAKALSVWFNFQGQSGPMAIEMNGDVDGDSVKGTTMIAGTAGGDWTATREKAASTPSSPSSPSSPSTPPSTAPSTAPSTPSSPSSPSLTGTWNVTVVLPEMTANPTLALKQDGEKLTGEYVSAQYGKFPVSGTVKGSDVTFGFTMNIESNAINVTYTGTVDKDGAIKGSVNYGDMMSGTFSAAKNK
jgi:hypothetical protein